MVKRIFNIFSGVFIGLCALVIIFLIWPPLESGWQLRHELLTALDNASSVRVVEHSYRSDNLMLGSDNKEVTYATVSLTPDQIKSLRWELPITLDYNDRRYGILKCMFEEHHYIEITQKDGSVLTLHICFHCGEIRLNSEEQRVMPMGWYYTLSHFISSIGLHPNGPWDKYPDGPK